MIPSRTHLVVIPSYNTGAKVILQGPVTYKVDSAAGGYLAFAVIVSTPPYVIDDDPRITRVGSFLRRTSLDELPQLIHVLQGEMTLIGPRPIVREEMSKYSIYADKLLSVKPGMSGLWQTAGRSRTTYRERVHLDMHYIDHRCLLFDLQLIVLTVVEVLRKSGAC